MRNCAASVGRRFLCESCVERAIEFGLLCDEPLQLCFRLCALATRQDASYEFGAKLLDLVVDVEHVARLCVKWRGAHRAGAGGVEDRESDRRSRRAGEPKCAAFWGDRSSSTRPAPARYDGKSEETDGALKWGWALICSVLAGQNRVVRVRRDQVGIAGEQDYRLARSSALPEKTSVLLSQPIEHRLRVDCALEESGVLRRELPFLQLHLFNHGSEFDNLLLRGEPNPRRDGMIGVELFEDRTMVRVDRVAADLGFACQRGDAQSIHLSSQRRMFGRTTDEPFQRCLQAAFNAEATLLIRRRGLGASRVTCRFEPGSDRAP